jgi:hypothetical protein
MTLLLVGVHGALVLYGGRAGVPAWLLVALGVIVVCTWIVDARARQHARRQLSAARDTAQLVRLWRDAA